jgi:dephospho-CoA kinase
VAALVATAWPGAEVEHIGSSAVPGLPGKNIVDLGIEADPADIPGLTDALRSLGFQPQGTMAPFPPTRPMLIGAVDEGGETFRIHLHVMPPARRELAELRAFRDALRADDALRDAYAAAKRGIVEAAPDGEANQLYTVHKGDFVQEALYRLGIRRGPADAPQPLGPGTTIGIMGGGQLGRMLGFAARAMGYRIVALTGPGLPDVGSRGRDPGGRLRRRRGGPAAGVDVGRRHLRA